MHKHLYKTYLAMISIYKGVYVCVRAGNSAHFFPIYISVQFINKLLMYKELWCKHPNTMQTCHLCVSKL